MSGRRTAAGVDERANMGHLQAFQEKVVVLTGATSGIGQAMSRQLAAAGAHLMLAARNEERLRRMEDQCGQRGGSAAAVATDVTAEAACRRLMEAALARHGRIDALINNAGQSMWARVDEVQDLALVRRMMEVNYFGSVYCTHYALPHLKASQGRIGVIASLTGRVAVPTRAAYAASKIALTRFHESLRIELHRTGVSVTVVFPDFVATEIRTHALGGDNRPLGDSPLEESRMMTAEQCAALALRAIAQRQRGPILSLRGNAAVIAKQFWPGLVDLIARRAIRKGK